MKVIQVVLGVLMLGAFLFFGLGEILMPDENTGSKGACQVFQSEWVQVLEDGTRIPAQVSGQNKAEYGQWLTLETVLPENFKRTWLCFRSMQQDMKFYVDDELRKEYSTIDIQPFGKTSTMGYVFVEMNDEDAGKNLRVEFMSDSFYAGFMDQVLIGDKADILTHFMMQYAPSAVVAAFMFLLGMGVVGCCLLVIVLYKKESELMWLGVAITLASTWLLAESKIRQFFLPNSTMAMNMGFFVIMLLPYPFLSYINQVQKKRYEKVHKTILICSIVNFVICTMLQVFNIKDFFETMRSSHLILIATILDIFVTILMDIIHKEVREYQAVALGFGSIVIAGVWEISLTYIAGAKFNGIPLCISLVLLLLAAVMKTGKDILRMEREKQMALSASESKAQFLANMSHEIRTPINTMLGMNEMILRENKDETIAGYARHIGNAGQMLLGIINDILDFSKIEAGKLEIVQGEYSLASMLQDVELDMRNRAEQKGLAFYVEIDKEMPAVLKGDELRIKQILNNLLSNAVKYTEKGSITFKVQGVQNENTFSLVVSVTDTGIGIHSEELNRLFESFQRLEIKKTRYIQGTGLGLCITKQLVEEMKGDICVSSEYGKGSCFTVTIPQEIIAMTEPEQLKSQKETTEENGCLLAPDAQIMIVDDNEINLMVTEVLLKQTEVQVELAMRGMECLEKTRKKKYDLILMDHMMPELDGVQTLHMLRKEKDNVNQDTKVIVLTANAIQGAAEEYMEEGFDDYLSKPIEPDKLEMMLRKYLPPEKIRSK